MQAVAEPTTSGTSTAPLSTYTFPATKPDSDSTPRSDSPAELSPPPRTPSTPAPPMAGSKVATATFSYDPNAAASSSRRSAEPQTNATASSIYRPRTVSTERRVNEMTTSAANMERSSSAPATAAEPSGVTQPMEYSALGREIVAGGQVHRVMTHFPFADYLSAEGGGQDALGGPPAPHPPPPHPAYMLQQEQQRQHAAAVAAAAGQAQAQQMYQQRIPHPQQIPLQYAPQQTPPQWRPPPPPCCPPGEPCQHPHSTQMAYSGGAHTQRMAPNVYYSPYSTPNMMVRSTSGQSSSASSAYSDSEASYSYSSQQSGSDYETGVCNPAYIHSAHGIVPSSSYPGGGMPHSYYGPVSHGGEVSFVGLGGLRAASTPDLNNMDQLRIHDGGMGYSFPGSESPPELHRGLRRDTTIRGDSGAKNRTVKPRTSPGRSSSRTTARAIFHPTPQAMLAPHAVRRNGRLFPGTNSIGLPTDEEFSRMPTKRSRGRRPPCSPDLIVSNEDPNANPSDAQIRYCGVTKTGKPKKIFLCKVPECGKCFKRSEHLKRHVRSIHTNEKPFQCQWPSCYKYFSRHDNLNQHLRIHRLPGQSDAEFSTLLEAAFGRNMDQIQLQAQVSIGGDDSSDDGY